MKDSPTGPNSFSSTSLQYIPYNPEKDIRQVRAYTYKELAPKVDGGDMSAVNHWGDETTEHVWGKVEVVEVISLTTAVALCIATIDYTKIKRFFASLLVIQNFPLDGKIEFLHTHHGHRI